MPEPTNDQAAMQQKMMKYMTGFMGLLFYKVASGLCLYFIASSLWGLGERRLLKKAKQDDASGGGQSVAKKTTPTPRGPTNGSSNGSPGKRSPKRSANANVSYDPHDTIAAIATADGGSARGMIRVSGPTALNVVKRGQNYFLLAGSASGRQPHRRGARRLAAPPALRHFRLAHQPQLHTRAGRRAAHDRLARRSCRLCSKRSAGPAPAWPSPENSRCVPFSPADSISPRQKLSWA